MGEEACRIDVWLWRARFSKTRTLAARLAEEGRIRVARNGRWTRLDKASRTVRPGDELVFAVAGRLTAVRVVALGERRGPAGEALALYARLDTEPGDADGPWPRDRPSAERTGGPSHGGIDKVGGRHR